jgi:hypothetical protein
MLLSGKSLAVPAKVFLGTGIGFDLLLAFLGFSLFKIIRRKFGARKTLNQYQQAEPLVSMALSLACDDSSCFNKCAKNT